MSSLKNKCALFANMSQCMVRCPPVSLHSIIFIRDHLWTSACCCAHVIPNWSVLAKAPVRDPSARQAEGPNAAASPTQMDLTAGGCPCKPPGPPPTDGVSQWECRYTSIPIKAWTASEVTFRCCVLLGQEGRGVFFVCLLW